MINKYIAPQKQTSGGFTIVELMITLIIAVIITSLGIITMSGYLPKQRLISTSKYIENLLTRGQAEAYSRAVQVGVRFTKSGSDTRGAVFLDSNANFLQDAGEGEITYISFKPRVEFTTTCPVTNTDSASTTAGQFPDCSDTTLTGAGCYVYFDSSGQAIDDLNAAIDYELFIFTSSLNAPYNSREIEVISSGFVQIPKQGQTGSASPGEQATNCTS
jgi:type II secretory pathway pseudopilin PulG